MKYWEKVSCKTCGKAFIARKCFNRKFCSKHCNGVSFIGRKHNPNAKTRLKGANSKDWKGNECSYRNKHRWLENNLGVANHCEICGASQAPKEYKRYFHWANLDHKYSRKTEDYKQMCIPCHSKHDIINKLRLWKKKKAL